MRYRARRVIVKARVSKLRGGGSRAAYAHLKYLQRDGSDIERTTDELDTRKNPDFLGMTVLVSDGDIRRS